MLANKLEGPASLDVYVAWLAVSTPVRWRSLLERLSTTRGSASRDGVLIEALNAPNPGIRGSRRRSPTAGAFP